MADLLNIKGQLCHKKKIIINLAYAIQFGSFLIINSVKIVDLIQLERQVTSVCLSLRIQKLKCYLMQIKRRHGSR